MNPRTDTREHCRGHSASAELIIPDAADDHICGSADVNRAQRFRAPGPGSVHYGGVHRTASYGRPTGGFGDGRLELLARHAALNCVIYRIAARNAAVLDETIAVRACRISAWPTEAAI